MSTWPNVMADRLEQLAAELRDMAADLDREARRLRGKAAKND